MHTAGQRGADGTNSHHEAHLGGARVCPHNCLTTVESTDAHVNALAASQAIDGRAKIAADTLCAGARRPKIVLDLSQLHDLMMHSEHSRDGMRRDPRVACHPTPAPS